MVSFPTLICGIRLNESQWATGWHLSARTDYASYNLPSFSWKRMVALTSRLQRFIRITCPIWILTRVVSFSGKICASNVRHGYVNTYTEKKWDVPPNILYKPRLIRQQTCSSLRCSWIIACRRCSNYIFILDSTPGFSGLGKDSYKKGR